MRRTGSQREASQPEGASCDAYEANSEGKGARLSGTPFRPGA
jgi:hypothetical protein